MFNTRVRHRCEKDSITQLTAPAVEPCSDGRAPPRRRRDVYAGRADPNVAFQASYCSKSDWATVAAVTAKAASKCFKDIGGIWDSSIDPPAANNFEPTSRMGPMAAS